MSKIAAPHRCPGCQTGTWHSNRSDFSTPRGEAAKTPIRCSTGRRCAQLIAGTLYDRIKLSDCAPDDRSVRATRTPADGFAVSGSVVTTADAADGSDPARQSEAGRFVRV